MREEGASNGEKKSDDDEVGMMMIPCLDFSLNNKNNNGLGSLEEWKKMMSKKVREACEKHGYFVLVCDDDEIVPKVLREKMVMGLKELFDLPEETKKKHQSTTKPYSSYTSDCPVIPLNQSFGVCDSHVFHVSQEFTNLMWPHGNPSFCETMNSISSKLLELNYMILKMIEEGYELPKHYIDIEDMLMKGTVFLRLMKYKTPSKENKKEGEIGLVTHTDKNTLTILCQNDVQGLEVQTKTGKWIQLEIPQNAYVVVVGDILKAWSNGRLHAVRHRVTMKGDKERYSFGVFTMPKDEAKIEVPPELVDANTHPLRYHPFTYGDYIKFFVSNLNENALDEFAAL